ncbi:efflux RND transporter permease subunit [Sinomicrobium weinanense]|uniref:Efflux RND transporter permease subunit n=1 Tax=Sinomicrobium weinanense TaxID=2842200 RepID=A0A926Q4C4_9FLAO|nr:efflux RND transporter permease subunit [Sinomicrobium weinanense]MBC9797814.1 efflux RND transporter permease subunit [Sinomicrobium weinanense]MBU3125963.1 efflux RND transporter permease subunit [Sinomicrobium weinanense]
MVKFLIHKPIGSLMTTLAIVILGLIAITHVPISLMPDLDIPEITVQLNADNMSARELEDAIVTPLRNSLMQVSHLEDIQSEASNGNAIIRLHFTYGTKTDYAFIEVNEKVDRAMASLPRELERPKVIKASSSDIPVFYLNLTLKHGQAIKPNGKVSREFIDFNRFVSQVVRKRIEQVPEVAMVDINGLVYSEILVLPDHNKLRALGFSLDDLEAAIKKQDIEVGSILVKESQYQYNLRLGTNLGNVRDIENIYLQKDGRVFQIRDLAEVREQPQKRTGLVLSDGKEAISMALIKQSDTRMKDLKESLKVLMVQMQEDYPDIDFSITRDQTRLLDYSINNLAQSLLWGILLAFAIMFLFLRDLKSPVLIGISVPVSMIVCILFFHLLDISINIISLSGLILGTGLMIDNSIIVIDNITQYREKGYSLSDACVLATNEVFKPLLSSALTTCAVFIPLIFLSGIAGALFYDQAMAITIGLFVSLIVSVTVLPVLYRLFYLKNNTKDSKITRLIRRLNTLDYNRFYERGFRWTMRKQTMAFVIFTILAVCTIVLFSILPKNRMPELSTPETLLVIDWNDPIHVEENKRRLLELIESLQENLETYHSHVGQQQFLLDKNSEAKSSEATLYLQAESEEKLQRLENDIMHFITENYPRSIAEYKEVDNVFNMIFSDNSAPLTARLRPVENIVQNEELQILWQELKRELPDVDLSPIAWEESLTFRANGEKMIAYNVSEDRLSNTLQSAFNEKEVLSIMNNQEFVPVVLGGEENNISKILQETMVGADDSTYYHVNEFLISSRGLDLKTVIAGKEGEYYPLDLEVESSSASQIIEKIKNVIDKNSFYDVSFSGSIFKNQQLIQELLIVLSITLILLYFILASQFESLTLPLIILIEIPVSISGTLFLLILCGMGLNLMSMIGIVVMCGIVINDSILKIDTVIQLQKQGYGLLRSLLIAGQRRLKPILMTSLTTILALLPVLFTGGLGGELQTPLAIALIGGMLLGTVVSLYLIPLCYYHLVRKKAYVYKKGEI